MAAGGMPEAEDIIQIPEPPVVSDETVSIDPATGLLFIGDFSGFVHCLDAETGKLQWVYDMKAHMWGSTFVVDGKVYVGDEDGDFVVLKVDRTMKLISETKLMGDPSCDIHQLLNRHEQLN